METAGGGSAAAAGAALGLKRPRGDDDDSTNSANSSDCDEWLVSDSGSEEYDDDEIQGKTKIAHLSWLCFHDYFWVLGIPFMPNFLCRKRKIKFCPSEHEE